MLSLLFTQVTYLHPDAIPTLSIEVTAPVPPELPTAFTIRKKIKSETELATKVESSTLVTVKRLGGRTDQTEISIEGVRGRNTEIELNDMTWETADGNIDLFSLPGKISSISIVPQGTGTGGALIKIRTGRKCTKKFLLFFGSEKLAGEESNLCVKIGQVKFNISSGGLSTDGDFPFMNNRGTFLNPEDDFQDRRKNNQFSRKYLDFSLFYKNLTFHFGRTSILRGEPGLITFPGKYTHSYTLSNLWHVTWKRENLSLYMSEGRNRENYYDPYGEFRGFPEKIETRFIQRETGVKYTDKMVNNLFWRYRAKVREILLLNSYTGKHRRSEFFQYPSIILSREKTTLFLMIALNLVDNYFTTNPSIGFKIGCDTLSVAGNFSTHTNYPTMYELYFSHGVIQNNPKLEPGKGWYSDLTLNYRGYLTSTLKIFYRKDEKLIDYFLISGFRYKPLALSNSLQRGATLIMDKNFNSFTIHFSGTFNDTIYSTNGKTAFIPYIPMVNIAGTAKIETNPSFKISVIYQRRIYLNLSNTKYIDYQWRSDGEVIYHFSQKFSIRFYYYNIFSTSFWSIRGFPTPLREWEIDLIAKI